MWKLAVLFFAVFGIYLGWFSPTEAAAVAAFVAILIAFFTRQMDWRGLLDAMLETVYTTASIFFIVVGAFVFSRFIVLTQFPNEVARWVQAAGVGPFWILAAVIGLYVLLGTFLDEVSTILITVPVTLPLVLGRPLTAFGFARCGCAPSADQPAHRYDGARDPGAHPDIPCSASISARCRSWSRTSCWWDC